MYISFTFFERYTQMNNHSICILHYDFHKYIDSSQFGFFTTEDPNDKDVTIVFKCEVKVCSKEKSKSCSTTSVSFDLSNGSVVQKPNVCQIDDQQLPACSLTSSRRRREAPMISRRLTGDTSANIGVKIQGWCQTCKKITTSRGLKLRPQFLLRF